MRKLITALLIATLTVVNSPASMGAVKAGAKCSKVGAKAKVKALEFTCVKSGNKLTWSKGKKVSVAKETVNQVNARRAAANYLSISPFSRSGLIEQLEFEGFNTADATYGVDSQKANWKEQAAKSAKNYLKLTSFSRSGLIEQLEFEGFTLEEATFGVDTTGLK
jgi:hypothetical protein